LVTLERKHVLMLWGAGLAFVTASVLMARVRGIIVGNAPSHGHEASEEAEEGMGERVVDIIMNICAMCFAWCILMGARWAWMLHPLLGIHVCSIDGRILLSLILSLLTFFVVYGLDKVDDALRKSNSDTKTAERAILSIISAVSVLVGFTWEHSFDGAVTAVADLNADHPKLTKFVLGVVVFAFLLRPWRRYILKRSLQLEDLKKARDHAKNELMKAPKAASVQDQAPLIQKNPAACGACF